MYLLFEDECENDKEMKHQKGLLTKEILVIVLPYTCLSSQITLLIKMDVLHLVTHFPF